MVAFITNTMCWRMLSISEFWYPIWVRLFMNLSVLYLKRYASLYFSGLMIWDNTFLDGLFIISLFKIVLFMYTGALSTYHWNVRWRRAVFCIVCKCSFIHLNYFMLFNLCHQSVSKLLNIVLYSEVPCIGTKITLQVDRWWSMDNIYQHVSFWC